MEKWTPCSHINCLLKRIMRIMKIYKISSLNNIPDYLQKMFGLGKYKPETKYHKCKKCGKNLAYWREDHPDTDMNEMVEYCKKCGAI